jgi:excinuclease ABC subunit C
MDGSTVRERVSDLPREPGIYQFLGDEGTVLYVGKAVELRDRVYSYADPRSERIRRMVERAHTIDFAVTDTETQALLLEANLIKRHQPKYNVRLKDDKSYPLVQLTDHEFPRIEITRDPDEAATVYGPYTDKGRVDTVVKALRETYGVRGCSDHKFANRDRPCLDYDIGLCTAPCTGEITHENYLGDTASVKRFFEGETGILLDPLQRAMEEASQTQQFERAANLRDRVQAVETFHGDGGEAVITRDERTVDVLGVASEGNDTTVARLRSEDGKLVDRERHTLSGPSLDSDSSVSSDSDFESLSDLTGSAGVLNAFIPQYYAERRLPDTLLLPEHPSDGNVVSWLEGEGVTVNVPGAGREATLVDLALKNARREVGQRDEAGALADALGLDSIQRIEGFDVSHAQGTAVVGSNVTFVDGQPEKSDYRRKKLTERNDDYANMRELVRWRTERAVSGQDDRPIPDLLLIDGGDGQLGAAMDALAETGAEIPCIALAKAEELVITPDRTFNWENDAPQLHLLQRVRDEAHRFAVQYHQTIRDEVKTVLDDVYGIGPKTRANLLGRFGSVENIRAASIEEITTVPGIGEQTAQTLQQRL